MLSLFCFFCFSPSAFPRNQHRYKVNRYKVMGAALQQQTAATGHLTGKEEEKNWFDTEILTLDWEYKYFFWGEEMIIISIIIFPVEIRKILNRVVVDRKAKSTLLFPFLKLKRKKNLFLLLLLLL